MSLKRPEALDVAKFRSGGHMKNKYSYVCMLDVYTLNRRQVSMHVCVCGGGKKGTWHRLIGCDPEFRRGGLKSEWI